MPLISISIMEAMKKCTLFINLTLFVLILASCASEKHKIGFSQCSTGPWRDQMNREMRSEVVMNEDVEFIIKSSQDDPQQQIKDIRQMVDDGIEVLIVSPGNVKDITPEIEKIHRKGIPVVMIDRKAYTKEYDAYIGGDNEEVGLMAASYIANKRKGGKIIELQGDVTMSPCQDRHRGFIQQLQKLGLDYESYATGWTIREENDTVNEIISNTDEEMWFFCHNDGMAGDVHKIAANLGKTDNVHVVGVDCILGEGVENIEKGILDASVRYPTGGHETIISAIMMLNSDRVHKHDMLIHPLMIDASNVSIIRTEDERIMALLNNNAKISNMVQEYSIEKDRMQVFICILCVILVALVLISVVMHKKNVRLRQKAEQELDEYVKEHFSAEQAKPVEKRDITQTVPVEPDQNFDERLRECLAQNMADCDTTVESLAASFGLGRTQFFRKVKMHTGYSPMELLRIARMKQAALLIEQSDRTVQEISYLVGFNNPSYFAKCFREYHGVAPSEYKRNN